MTDIEKITKELKRIGLDASTLGRMSRGVHAVDGGGGVVALFEGRLGPMYVSRPKPLLKLLRALPGGRGALDGVKWLWNEVFDGLVEPKLQLVMGCVIDDIRESTPTGVTAAMHRLEGLGVQTHYVARGFADEEEIAVGNFLGLSRYDVTRLAPEENWQAAIDACTGDNDATP